jgi:PEGA domain
VKAVAGLLTALVVSNSAIAQQPQAAAPAPVEQAAPAPSQAPTQVPPLPDTLLDGTPVKLRLAENLSSETNKTGDQVPFEVTEEVDVDGVAVIPKGAQALATVTDAEPKKRMGRGGKLDVNVDSVRLADGEKAQLRASKDTKGGGHVGAMTGAMVATSLVFFPAAPLFLFMHGKPVEIPKGTEVTAFVQGDMHLTMANFAPKPGPGDAASPAGATTASLTIESSQSGADIEIDGSFVGNTPSTVSVAAGQHTIAVKKKGYADWSRTMTVSGGSVHLNADLEVAP